MANSPNTSVSAFGAPLLHPGWDRAARFELRSKPLFRQFVSVRVQDPTNKAKVYYMPVHKYHDVASDRHVVDEVVAADTVQSKASDYVRISIAEHGHAVGRTTLLEDTAYIPVDPVIAAQGAQHMADTLDEMVADQLYVGDQKRNDGTEAGDSDVAFDQVVGSVAGDADFGFDHTSDRGELDPSADDFLSARITRRVVAKLRNASAVPMLDTGAVGWHEPHINVDTSNLYSGEIGRYAGVAWIEHPRARVVEDEGAGSADVHQTVIFGREVLSEHVTREPGFGLSPMLDTYNRHRTIYWYGTLGFGIYRQEPLWRVEHAIGG
jgi:hypothetical protein